MGVKDGSGLHPSTGRVRICLLSAQGSWFGVDLLNSDPVRIDHVGWCPHLFHDDTRYQGEQELSSTSTFYP